MYSIRVKVISLLSIMAVISCDDKDKSTTENQSNFKEWTIQLENNLGAISISLPDNMDTFLNGLNTPIVATPVPKQTIGCNQRGCPYSGNLAFIIKY